MHPDDLTDAVHEISDRYDRLKEAELEALAEKAREYPNGFEFYYKSTTEGLLDKACILGVFNKACILGVFIPAIRDPQIWYRCYVPSWTFEVNDYVPVWQSVIAKNIERFGTPS